MDIEKVSSYEELSKKAANILVELLREKPAANLGLATGSTPVGMYEQLIKAYQEGNVSFQDTHTYNLDEYIGLERSDPNSYHYFMKKTLFDHIDINPDHTHIPSGIAEDLEEECVSYERLIKANGGIDIQILGLGLNGHIGFNEPGTDFASRTHIVKLAESTRTANARFFSKKEDVPKQAITMGIQSIMEAKKIVLLAFGKKKMDPLQRLMKGVVHPDFPASILRLHPNITIIYGE
nr:glucosamine-6-phosphate deaminase [Salirhabdus euzebyi]